MSDPPPLLPTLPESFDGFRLELDPERQRADVILDRLPLGIQLQAEAVETLGERRHQRRRIAHAIPSDTRRR